MTRYAAFLRAINVGGRTATKDRLVGTQKSDLDVKALERSVRVALLGIPNY